MAMNALHWQSFTKTCNHTLTKDELILFEGVEIEKLTGQKCGIQFTSTNPNTLWCEAHRKEGRRRKDKLRNVKKKIKS